jgi:SRSO17 transposase
MEIVMKKTEQTEESSAVKQSRSWAESLEEVAKLIGGRFSRSESRVRALIYLCGLLSPVERKNGWQLAEEAGDETPYATQHLLGRAVWSADDVRDDLREYVVKHLGDEDGVLVVDETGFLKKGTKSAGVRRQYSGTAGRVENCQIGVFLAYATRRGRTLLDRELYLPQEWTEEKERLKEAGVQENVGFATKLVMARRLIERAWEGGVPFRWVTGDAVYGSDSRLRGWLQERKISYVLAVTSQHRVFYEGMRRWVSEIAVMLPIDEWKRISAGAGMKGERQCDWARISLGEAKEGQQRWLLFRRSMGEKAEIAYYTVSAPEKISLEEIVKVAGTRWAIEESFESAKGEVGLDHYEVRSWDGWYRHITLSMLAHAYLTVVRAHGDDQKKMRRVRRNRKISSR